MKKIPIITLVVLLIAGGIYTWYNRQSDKTITPDFLSDQSLDWQTYQNTKYNYSVEYPASVARVGTNNDYGWNELPVQESINFGVAGKTTLFSIEVDTVASTSTLLKDFAEDERNRQIDDTNSHTDPEVGEMREVMFAGKTAYSFTLTDAYSTSRGGYALGDGQKYNYLFTENADGKKIIIHYLIESDTYPEGVVVAKQMRESFTFR